MLKWQWTGYAALAIAVLAVPHIASSYMVHVLILAFLYLINVNGLNLVYGITGQLSLGQAAFYGIGAYTAFLLNLKLGLGFVPGLLGGMLLAGIAGAFLGVPSLRLKGSYLIISTISFGKIVTLIITNWISLTRGPLGLTGIGVANIAIPGILQVEFADRVRFYYLTAVFVLLSHVLIRNMLHSRTGRALLAVREDQLAAEALGVNASNYKILAFVTSAVMSGAAGVLYSYYIRAISPESFTVVESIDFLVYLVLGGTGNLWGPTVGVISAHLLLEQMRVLGNWRLSLYGVVLFVMTKYFPRGLMGMMYSLVAEGRRRLAGESGRTGSVAGIGGVMP